MLEEDLQDVVRSILIFGLHVHIGMPDRQTLIEIMNEVRYFLPHILALSTSSPFWLGRETGLKSYRTIVWSQFPRTGIPEQFSSWEEYENYVNLLVKTNCIDNGKKIWWDVRPHPQFNTLEFRVCDMPVTADETIAIAALFQAMVARLYQLREQNLGFRLYPRSLVQENKWRAARYGMDGKLIDFGKRTEVPTRAPDRGAAGLRRSGGGRTGQPRGAADGPADHGARAPAPTASSPSTGAARP